MGWLDAIGKSTSNFYAAFPDKMAAETVVDDEITSPDDKYQFSIVQDRAEAKKQPENPANYLKIEFKGGFNRAKMLAAARETLKDKGYEIIDENMTISANGSSSLYPPSRGVVRVKISAVREGKSHPGSNPEKPKEGTYEPGYQWPAESGIEELNLQEDVKDIPEPKPLISKSKADISSGSKLRAGDPFVLTEGPRNRDTDDISKNASFVADHRSEIKQEPAPNKKTVEPIRQEKPAVDPGAQTTEVSEAKRPSPRNAAASFIDSVIIPELKQNGVKIGNEAVFVEAVMLILKNECAGKGIDPLLMLCGVARQFASGLYDGALSSETNKDELLQFAKEQAEGSISDLAGEYKIKEKGLLSLACLNEPGAVNLEFDKTSFDMFTPETQFDVYCTFQAYRALKRGDAGSAMRFVGLQLDAGSQSSFEKFKADFERNNNEFLSLLNR